MSVTGRNAQTLRWSPTAIAMMSSALIAARSPMLALATFRFAPPRMDASDDRQKKIDAIFATGDDQDYLLNRDSLVSTEMDLERAALGATKRLTSGRQPCPQIETISPRCFGWTIELCGLSLLCHDCTLYFLNGEGDGDFGTARVTMQGGDDSEVIEEAIDVCPADCIHTCSRNELEILEEYRSLYLNELLAKWQARRLVSNGEGGGGSAAPHWRDPLVNIGWQKGPKYVRSARLRMERPLLKDDV